MASTASSRSLPILRHLCAPRRPFTPIPRSPSAFRRAAHSIPRPPPKKPLRLKPEAEAEAYTSREQPLSEGQRPAPDPAYYQLSFTCVPCGHRSHHNVSKQGYHMGSTLITCPSCRNRHVISDHLNIFGDRKITVEELVRERGQLVKRGSLGEDGDVEFWPDESNRQQDVSNNDSKDK